MSITIKDVAKLGNVSAATVSRVLNGLGGYSEETKNKILNIVDEVGYQRNAVAIWLSTNITKTIAVIVPDVSTNFDGEILRGVEETAHKNNYSVIICNAAIEGVMSLDYLKILLERKIDAVILVSIKITDKHYEVLKHINIPYVLISTTSDKYNMPYIKVDDESAAYMATKYLIELGHKNIAMISGTKSDTVAGWPRVQGYMNALSDYGIEIEENLIKYGNFSYESGIKCMNELLKYKEKFTAIFVASDDMAVGVLNVAYKNNIRVPDQLSIIGYDNTKVAKMAIPPLTTLAQPLYEMGCESFNRILDMMKNRDTMEGMIMEHRIIERETVRCLK